MQSCLFNKVEQKMKEFYKGLYVSKVNKKVALSSSSMKGIDLLVYSFGKRSGIYC